jgi:murein L,D-transpeptidase YcbB/YkuD
MSGRRRYDRILSSTALALILIAPLGAGAQDASRNASKQNGEIARYSPEQNLAPASPATTTPAAGGPPASAVNAPVATDPAPPSDPLASVDPADRPIAEKIRDLLVAKGEKFFANKNEREAVETLYQSRNLLPLWLDKGVENARAKAVIARLKHADADGLNPRDYATPDFAGANFKLAADSLAEAELKLTQAVLTYVRHVQAGRFPYIRVTENIELPQKLPEPAHVLAAVADAADAGKALDAFSPPQEPYRRLKAKLAELRGKPGAHATGHDRQIDTIIVNMERWRWYPRDLGNAHVLVNAPDFMLKVMHDGAQIWTTKVVIGEVSKQTPLLSETMKSITVNPTWRVPPSIVQNEYLSAQRRDPGVLARMGLRVSYKNGEVMITQPPGPDNALGQIRFNFPNRLLVYQHDTRRVDLHMFGEKVRAYSHGCMRVQDPAKYAEVLLGIARPDDHWTAQRIKSMFGNGENDKDIQLQSVPIWVHLTYQTAFVDDEGKLQIRRDLYNLDSRTLAVIKSEHGIVEPASERESEPTVAFEAPRKPARAHARSAARHRRAPSSYQSTVYGASGHGGLFPPRPNYYR